MMDIIGIALCLLIALTGAMLVRELQLLVVIGMAQILSDPRGFVNEIVRGVELWGQAFLDLPRGVTEAFDSLASMFGRVRPRL